MIPLHSTNGCKGKMKKKSSDARGDLNRNKILEFIKSKSLDWEEVEVKQIVKYTKLSRTTVNTHLNALSANGKIIKTIRGGYLPTESFDAKVDLDDEWSLFQDYLYQYQPLFLNKDLKILNLKMLRYTIRNLIEDRSNARKADLKKYIFEYANRVGAYLVYVFIESLRPLRNVKSDHLRHTLTKRFLYSALLPWTDLLVMFRGDIPIKMKGKRHYELDDSAWEKVSEAYKNLYPYWTELLEVALLHN